MALPETQTALEVRGVGKIFLKIFSIRGNFSHLFTHIYQQQQEGREMKDLEQIRPSIILRREEGFYTLSELASEIGVNVATVSKWADVGTIIKPTHRWRHHPRRRYYNKQEYDALLTRLRGKK